MQTESTNLIEFLAHVAWYPWAFGVPSLELPGNLWAVGNNTVRLIIVQEKLVASLEIWHNVHLFGRTFI